MQWHEDLGDSIAARWLVFGLRPSLTSLYEFRDRIAPLLEGLIRQVVRAAIAEGHTDGNCGALDGTFVAADASRHRLVNLEAVERRLEALGREAAEAGCGAAGAAATARGRRRRREHCLRARAALHEKLAANARRRKDKRKPAREIRVALGDPEAPFGLDKLKTYRPLYNVQVMSDLGTDLVLAYAATAAVADNGQLTPMIERTVAMTGRPLREVLVDSGYPSGAELARCRDLGVTAYAPWNENSFTEAKRAAKGDTARISKDRFAFDPTARAYRCPEGKALGYHGRSRQQRADGEYFTIEVYRADPAACAACPLRPRCVRRGAAARTVRRQEHEELVEELKRRMAQPEAKERYRLRCRTVERRFADAKTHRGLARFSGRTRTRAEAQLALTVLAHDLRTLDKLRERRAEQRKDGELAT